MFTAQPEAYPRTPSLQAGSAGSAKSYAAGNRIRSVLTARDSSLREWAIAWAGKTGEPNRQRVINRVYRTVERWAGRDDSPRPGTLGAEIMTALRADLGAWVIPEGRDLTNPPTERRRLPRN